MPTQDQLNECARELAKAMLQRETGGAPDFDQSKYFAFHEKIYQQAPSDLILKDIKAQPLGALLLLNGQRGNGKTTELLRLKSLLDADERFQTFYVNLLEYVDIYVPIDVNHLLIAMAAAISEQVGAASGLDKFLEFLSKEVSLESIGLAGIQATGGGAEVKTRWFNLRLAWKGRNIVELIRKKRKNLELSTQNQVNLYLNKIFENHFPNKTIVFLFDSIEQARDTGLDAKVPVLNSLLKLFTELMPRLRLQCAISVWSAPPVLAKYANANANADSIRQNPIIPVVVRPTQQPPLFKPNRDMIAVMRDLLIRRVPSIQNCFDAKHIEMAAWFSSGSIRTAYAILREAIIQLPLDFQAANFQQEIHHALLRSLDSRREKVHVHSDEMLLNGIREKQQFTGMPRQSALEVTRSYGRLCDNNWVMTYFDLKPNQKPEDSWLAPSRLVDLDDALVQWQLANEQ